MPASCYLCSTSHQKIPGKTGSDAYGVCKVCSILSCDAHGHRDPNYPRWVCVICDTSLLAAAGASTAGAGQVAVLMTSAALLREAAEVESLKAFLRDRPEYSWLQARVDETIAAFDARFTTRRTELIWYSLSPEGRRLLAAALLIVEHYQIPNDELIEILRILHTV